MEMIEKLMSAFGGFGMDNVVDKNQKKALDDFNKLCLEFALKLDASVGIDKSDTILRVVVQVAKHSDSGVVDQFSRLLNSKRDLYEKKNPAFLELFPVHSKVEYDDMDSNTKASVWAYMDSLVKKADAYKMACKANPIEDLKKVKLDGIFGETLDDIREVFKKNNVDIKKMLKVTGEVFDCLPIDDLVSQIPAGALPQEIGFDPAELKQKKIKTQFIKLLSNVLDSE